MSDEKRTWYQRTHQFTPYTKADGTAVSDEFDAIQASFERIPAMRDDGKGFVTSPLIPEPSNPNHPVPFKMLTETEASVNNARDDVTKKAQQVAHNAQSVATNTQTTINQAKSASQSAESASASSRSASNSEEMARKWASNPENEVVLDEKYSAYHYAQKVAQSAANLASAESSAIQSATIATQKAEEATRAAQKAESLAAGEIDYTKVLNVPHSNINTEGVVRLTNDTGLESESLALTAKAGKKLAQQTAQLQLNVSQNYIPNSKKSSAVNSNSADTVATSAAVKTAYDKGVEAKTAADNAQHTADSKQSPATTLAGYGINNFKVENGSGNMNDYRTDGIYCFGTLYGVSNSPRDTNSDIGSGNLQVITGGIGNERWCRQIFHVHYSKDTYIRWQVSVTNDDWSAWEKLNDIEPVIRALGTKANISHTHTASQITGFNQATSQIINAAITYQKIGDFEVRKYPDGTMIQTYKKVNPRGITNKWIELHQFNWAVSFIDKPNVWASQSSDENTDNANDNANVSVTINSFVKFNNFKSSGSVCAYWEFNQDYDGAYKSMNWDFLAIGRWK